jgi:hypothetical protein
VERTCRLAKVGETNRLPPNTIVMILRLRSSLSLYLRAAFRPLGEIDDSDVLVSSEMTCRSVDYVDYVLRSTM